MQGCMILAIIGTEKDTLVFYSTQIVDGRTDGRTKSLTPILHPALSMCDKNTRICIRWWGNF